MVVVDSSALIPLSRVGELTLITEVFDEDVHTTTAVYEETVEQGAGYRGASEIAAFLDSATIHNLPQNSETIADLEGIQQADASVLLLAADLDEPLLANDKPLILAARARGIDYYWVTSLLLNAVHEGHRDASTARRLLRELVEEGMTLSPSVFSQITRRFSELEK